MGFILLEPDSIPSKSQEKCWVLALFLCISAVFLLSPFTNKHAASLLTLFRSERNEGMNSRTRFEKKSADLLFWDAFGAASSTQAVFIKMHETSLCLQQHSGTLTRSERWPRQQSPWVGPETCWYHAGPQGWDLVPWAAFEERNQGENGGNRRDKKRARVYSGISGHLLDLGAWCFDSF